MKSTYVSTFVLCVLALVALAAQDTPMRPGRWEVTSQMQMATMQMPPTTNAACVTAEELKKDPASGLPKGVAGAGKDACKVSDYKVVRSVATWKMQCTGDFSMTGTGEITFMGDTYAGTVNMNMTQGPMQGPMTMRLAGKRTGDCTAADERRKKNGD